MYHSNDPDHNVTENFVLRAKGKPGTLESSGLIDNAQDPLQQLFELVLSVLHEGGREPSEPLQKCFTAD